MSKVSLEQFIFESMKYMPVIQSLSTRLMNNEELTKDEADALILCCLHYGATMRALQVRQYTNVAGRTATKAAKIVKVLDDISIGTRKELRVFFDIKLEEENE